MFETITVMLPPEIIVSLRYQGASDLRKWKGPLGEIRLKQRRRSFSLPPIALDRASAEPIYVQFHAALERAIREGRLPAGSRLPSTRAAAKLCGVSRNTFVTAYEILTAGDWIESVTGSGTRVRRARAVAKLQDPDGNFLYLNL
jgi:DNA-binding transcriptional regulator YhcF (GntR family)